MNGLRCLLTLGLTSGLVACGSFANCFNSGLLAACGGGYVESDIPSLPQPTATSARKVARWARLLQAAPSLDGSWLFYSAKDQPNIIAGLVQGTGTSHSGSFGSSNTRDFNVEDAGIRAATIRGRYVPNKRFKGTIAYLNGDTASFTSTYDAEL